jgi:hypothetical protein
LYAFFIPPIRASCPTQRNVTFKITQLPFTENIFCGTYIYDILMYLSVYFSTLITMCNVRESVDVHGVG